jgi:two-component system, response regulator PdtaR
MVAMSVEGHRRVLLANDDEEELAGLARLVEGAGHEVVALAINAAEAGDAIVEQRPDLAMILIDDDEEHGLELMVEIRSFAEIPLVILARSISDDGLRRAADQTMEVLHLPGAAATVAEVIGLALRRHAEQRHMERRLSDLDGMLERRSKIEQAKGILMERHAVDEIDAFTMIRDHARANQLPVVDVAASIVTARDLLSTAAGAEPAPSP